MDLSVEDYERILRAGRSLHFAKRTWSSVIQEAGVDPSLRQTLSSVTFGETRRCRAAP